MGECMPAHLTACLGDSLAHMATLPLPAPCPPSSSFAALPLSCPLILAGHDQGLGVVPAVLTCIACICSRGGRSTGHMLGGFRGREMGLG